MAKIAAEQGGQLPAAQARQAGEGRVERGARCGDHHQRHHHQRAHPEAFCQGSRHVAAGFDTAKTGVHAYQAEGQNRHKAEHAGERERAQHGLFFADKAAVGQYRVVEGVADQLQAGHQKQIDPGVECPVTGAGQLAGAVIRQHQPEHPNQCDNEDGGLGCIGQNRAAQPAAQAVDQGDCSKQQGRGDEGRAAAVTVITADHGGIAPDLIEQANQDGGGEGQRGGAAVVAGQKADQTGCLKSPAQPVDH